MKTPAVRAAILCALLTSTAIAAPAFAQAPPPSVYQNIDGNGVDLTDGSFNFSIVEGSIGAGESALTMSRSYGRSGWTDGLPGRLNRTLSPNNNRISVTFDNRIEFFTLTAQGWTPDKGDGARLEGMGAAFTYTSADGTAVDYAPGTAVFGPVGDGGIRYCIDDEPGECALLPVAVRRPTGRAISLGWDVARACEGQFPTVGETCSYYPRLAAISNESGYLIELRYEDPNSSNGAPPPAWFNRTGAQFVNTAVPCQPAPQCWPTVAYAGPNDQPSAITDIGGRTWQFVNTTAEFSIQRPGSTGPNIVAARSNGIVSSVTADGVATTYARSVSGTTGTMTVTNARGEQIVVTSRLDIGRPTSVTAVDPTAAPDRTTGFQYDAFGRLEQTTAPEGNYTHLTYDARGNVTQTQHVSKDGAPTIATSATFPCTTAAACNSPATTTDARGNVTSYSYDSTHGGILSVTAPAVTVGGAAVSPQVRTAYTQIGGVHLVEQVSACQTTSSCAGTGDETRTVITYGANNQPASVTSRDGTGTLSATQTVAYDPIGNVVSADGPLAGAADTAHFRYDAARQQIGTVSPDPDGAGPLPPRASRTTYRPDGQVSRSETGVVNGPSDTDWAAMVVLEQTDMMFDTNNRPVVASHAAGGAMHSVVQTGYDAIGRAECTALRMNPASWTSLPASGCTPAAAGTHGPDRITRSIRNALGETTEVRTAVGTPLEAAERRMTYSLNGRALTVADGENNLTSYTYDGHDRLIRTQFPLGTQGALTSNPDDDEGLTYDAAGNVLTRRNRADETATYTYDALNRTIVKDLPGAEPDVVYAYDLLGRMTSASQTGHALSFTYDALGRQLTQTSPTGTVGSSWDLAGRRTRITHPGGTFYVDQDYLVTGEMSAIRENGATTGVGVLAAFGHDLLGRRTSLTRGNGTVTNYAFDPASRLSQLTQDFAGTTYDLTLGFTYNPASQILTNERSNDLYSFTGITAGMGPSAAAVTPANGRNQLTELNGTALSYDTRGNLIFDGSRSFTYTSENLLASVTVPAGTSQRSGTFSYDPMMRLSQFSSGSCTGCRWAYDGWNNIADYGSTGLLQRRYVHGPGGEFIASIIPNSSGHTRHWVHGDERGSPIGTSRENGTFETSMPTTFDEYGRQGGAPSMLGYTGARKLSSSILVYLRNRIYHPELGRFLQADPIGYGDGMNMYGYVGGDPVNRTDPSGLRSCDFDGERDAILVCGDPGGSLDMNASLSRNLGDSGEGCRQSSLILCAVGENGVAGGENQPTPDTPADTVGPDIFVDGQRPNRRPSTLRRAGACAADQFGLTTIVGGTSVVAGQPIPGSKRFVTPGSSRGTSVAGRGANALFGGRRFSRSVPTIVGGPGTGRNLAIARTRSVARAAGRAVPFVGWALLAYDAVSISVCTFSGD